PIFNFSLPVFHFSFDRPQDPHMQTTLPTPTNTSTTTATVAQHLAQAQSLLRSWLDALSLSPRTPDFFASNIASLNEATGILSRLAATDTTLPTLRHRDRTDGRMLNELNFLLDKILRLTKNKPLISTHTARHLTPLPPLPPIATQPTTHVECESLLSPQT